MVVDFGNGHVWKRTITGSASDMGRMSFLSHALRSATPQQRGLPGFRSTTRRKTRGKMTPWV